MARFFAKDNCAPSPNIFPAIASLRRGHRVSLARFQRGEFAVNDETETRFLELER